MARFVKVKKTQLVSVVIAGQTVVQRVKWNSDTQEFEVNVRSENQKKFSEYAAYFTSDIDDAIATAAKMAEFHAVQLFKASSAY